MAPMDVVESVSWKDFLIRGNLCLLYCGWSWILSFWGAVMCPVVYFGMSMGLVGLWAASLLMCRWLSSKEYACQYRRCRSDIWVGRVPWKGKWQPTPVFLPGKSHRQRSLTGYNLWGHRRVGHNLVTKQQQQQNFINRKTWRINNKKSSWN